MMHAPWWLQNDSIHTTPDGPRSQYCTYSIKSARFIIIHQPRLYIRLALTDKFQNQRPSRIIINTKGKGEPKQKKLQHSTCRRLHQTRRKARPRAKAVLVPALIFFLRNRRGDFLLLRRRQIHRLPTNVRPLLFPSLHRANAVGRVRKSQENY